MSIMKPFEGSNCDEYEFSRDRMLKLASISHLGPLTVTCDSSRDSQFVENVPLLMVCQSPLIDFPTYIEVLGTKNVFPVVRRDMSYSVEVCGNKGPSIASDDAFAPPNVNIFAPVNSVRRPVLRRIQPDENNLNGDLEYDVYSDIPSQDVVEFQYIRTPSVTSSRLSEYEDYNVLESDPGYVHLNSQVPQINSDHFFLPNGADHYQPEEPQIYSNHLFLPNGADHYQQEEIPPEIYSYEPSQMTNMTVNSSIQSTMQTISYTQSEAPISEYLAPQIQSLVPGDTPVLINMPVVYIIPMVPISIQPLFISPLQPSTNAYLPAPLAFNCVLRTPFPQFIYSVEPCQSPACPFSYRYRSPMPHPEQFPEQPAGTITTTTTTSCQFQRSSRFSYQCSNRQTQTQAKEEIEEDTPKRNSEAPPPVRRLSDKFVTPQQPNSPIADTIQSITTTLDNITLNGGTTKVQRTSQIKVQISSRNYKPPRRKYFARSSHSVEFRRSGREGVMKRFNQPRNMCFDRSSQQSGKIEELKLTAIRELNRDGNTLNCVDWLRIPDVRDFSLVRRPFARSSSSSLFANNRPYFLNMLGNGPLPNVLQEVSVPVINNTVCESMYQTAGYIEHIPNIFICAGWKKGGFDSCEGDSGGPMVIQRPDKRWLLAGIISWGIGCAEPNQPGVYTRISAFRDWINQILQF